MGIFYLTGTISGIIKEAAELCPDSGEEQGRKRILRMKNWSIQGATLYSPGNKGKNKNILISKGKIGQVTKEAVKSSVSIEIEDGIVAPGLINAHDHLLGTYYPKIGDGPYENWLPWDNDLKSSNLYVERQQIESRDLYLLGAYRNLVSGVTTVSDHIPHFVAKQYYDTLPMKAIRSYTLAHSVAPFPLSWGDGINIEYQLAEKKKIPFITHISEGFDRETIRSVDILEQEGGLGEYSVLVHGIAFTEADMKKIKKSGASVVWCGDSNVFMFDKTADIKMLLNKGINVCIGTDSPMSGGQNLLYEMRFDKVHYEDTYEEELPDETIFKMVTENAAKAFHQDNIGKIEKGNLADITVFRDNGISPVSSIVSADLEDIMLVVIDGKPAYGDIEFADLFESLEIEYQEIILKGRPKVIIGDVIGLLTRISRAVGFKKEYPFLPVEFEF
ncbi:MAG: amidohydrolase family protein [bacterium]|nr:amidohydrolase family protein [bacterium]